MTSTISQEFDIALSLHQAERLDEAERIYEHIMSVAPEWGEPRRLLGLIALHRGDHGRAITLFTESLARFPPDSVLPHLNLGEAYLAARMPAQAVESYRAAIAIRPGVKAAHNNLGHALNALGRYDEALAVFDSGVVIAPNMAELHIGKGVAFRGLLRLKESEEALRRAQEIQPDHIDVVLQLAELLNQLERTDQAEVLYQHALALRPGTAAVHMSYGMALARQQETREALAHLRRATELDAHSALPWAQLGRIEGELGDLPAAEAHLRHALAIDPKMIPTRLLLASVRREPPDQETVGALRAALDHPNTPWSARASAGFALGAYHDKAGRFDEAFSVFADANELVRRTYDSAGERFDGQSFKRYVNDLVTQLPADRLKEMSSAQNSSELPVFVVGMPRSGTSLIEQVMASHSRVYGAGELPDMLALTAGLAKSNAERPNLSDWNRDGIREAGDLYLARIKKLCGSAARVVDKAPDNLLSLHIISIMFPNARVIYVRRDPRDVVVSNFFRFYDRSNLFSYALADCVVRTRETRRLAESWLRTLPLPMIEIEYEALVNDFEQQSMRLVQFIGLDWEDGCRDFPSTIRSTVTPNAPQIRQPLHMRSIGRWQNYAHCLGATLDGLSGT